MEIYLITNLINGKQYVGQTVYTKERRWNGHKNGDLCVDQAIVKYKPENFKLETLELVNKEEDLNEREQYWIGKLNTLVPNGYNVLPGGNCHVGKSVSYDIEKYLHNRFYPSSNLKEARRIKMYFCNSEKFYDVIDEIVNFQEMYNTDLELWADWRRNFYKKASELITEDIISKIADKIMFFPSMRFLLNNRPIECHRGLYSGLVADCINNKWVLDVSGDCCGDKDNMYVAYFSTDVDNNEYDDYANKKIKDMLDYYNKNPMKLKDFLECEKHYRIAIHKSSIQQFEQKKIRIHNRKMKWLKDNTESCRTRIGKKQKVIIRFDNEEKIFVNMNMDDALHDACVWVLNALGRNPDDIDLICSDNKGKKPIMQYTKSGIFVQKYSSIAEAERVTGIKSSGISRCCRFKIPSFGGFLWCPDIEGYEYIIESKINQLKRIKSKREEKKQIYKDQYKYQKEKGKSQNSNSVVQRSGKRPMGCLYKTK